MKGSVLDVAMIPIVLGIVFIGAVFGLLLLNAFNSSGVVSLDLPNLASIFDYGIPLVAVGLFIASIAASYFIDTHPIFIVASFVILILCLIAMPAISNVFMGFASDPAISPYSTQMPLTLQLLGNIPLMVMLMGIGIIIALYAKSGSGSGGV